MCCVYFVFFFFFQAEDGIRDLTVTGVQTCALPIFYSGLRGVGKTVLLMELDVLATEAGWATTDVQEVGSQPDFRVTFARMAARLLREMSRKHRIKDRVERGLSVLRHSASLCPPACSSSSTSRLLPGSPIPAIPSRTSAI